LNVHVTASTVDDKVAELCNSQPSGYSLLQGFYNDTDVFRADIERLFMRHWLCAGHASSAPNPGDYFLYQMAEESIIIVRGQDHELRAFANVCRHRGSRICLKNEGHATVLVCPYHAWAYNLDGRLRSTRFMPADFDAASHGLKTIHLRVIEGLVLISFAEAPLDLGPAEAALRAAYGPYGWTDAKVAHRELYPIQSNWKLAVENYLECYHCGPSHKEYSRLHALEQPMDQIEGLNAAMEARTCALGLNVGTITRWLPSTSGEPPIMCFRYALYDRVKTGSEDGGPLAPLMGGFTDYDGGVTSTHFGPASFFVAYADHGVIYRFMPLTVSTCAMEVIWLVRGNAAEGRDYDRDKLTWLWRVTTEADKRITEDNQAGVNSRYYLPGPYAPMEANAKRYIAWYLGEVGRAY
jgi:phenylpropionate dioxygenase-like ring-hydroxylating dioxygenase large terminal subunit